jgi:CubicO group peptidase (beta-lactamase class C family)
MGCIGEKITGKKFAIAAKEALFDPIGIPAAYDTGMLAHPEMVAVSYEPEAVVSDSPRSTEGLKAHREWLAKSLENKKKLYDLPTGEAYRIAQGNAHIRAKDVLEVQNVFMRAGLAKNGTRVLSESAVAEMLKIQFSELPGGASEANSRLHAEKRGHTYISGGGVVTGLNLRHAYNLVDGVHMIGHSGRAYGAFTGSWFNLESKIGVAIMTNGTSPKPDKSGNTYTIAEALRVIYSELSAS